MAIEIGTIEQLVAFSEGDYGRGSSGSPLDVKLIADLDFADYEDGYMWSGCTGTWYVNFDGQGHKVDNIYYTNTAQWGFFNTVVGTVKNLKLTNIYVLSTGGCVAGIAVYPTGTIQNCHVSGNIETMGTIQATGFASGICWQMANGGTIGECSFSGVLKGGYYANGIGAVMANGIIRNCGVNADLYGRYTGGTGSSWNGYTAVVDCYFKGKQQATTIFIMGENAYVYNCYAVLKDGTSGSFSNASPSMANCLYDATVAGDAGIASAIQSAFPALTGATTAELQSVSWLRSKGFAV